MNKNLWIIIVIVLLIIVGVAYVSVNQGGDEMMDENDIESMKEMEDEMMDEARSTSDPQDDVMNKGADMMKAGVYEEYSSEKLARAEEGDVVLFFHASWCPSCRGLNKNIEENLDDIPAELSILKLDYDTETELKKKYGVTFQHTLVQVDADGNLIKKWSGSPTLSSLVSEVN